MIANDNKYIKSGLDYQMTETVDLASHQFT